MRIKTGQRSLNFWAKELSGNDLYFIDPWEVRTHSIKKAESLGYPISTTLPLVNKPQAIRRPEEAFQRMLSLYTVIACARGLDLSLAREWLVQGGFTEALSPQETELFTNGIANPEAIERQIEGLWALAWSLGLAKRFSFEAESDEDLIHLFPDIAKLEGSAVLRAKVKPRAPSIVFAQLDLAYCLHWSVQTAVRDGRRVPGVLPPIVIEERMKALEWLFSNEGWDDTALHT